MSRSWAAAWSGRAWRWRWLVRDCKVLLIEAVAADSAAQPSFDDRTTALGQWRAPHPCDAGGLGRDQSYVRRRSARSTCRMPATSASPAWRHRSTSSRPSATRSATGTSVRAVECAQTQLPGNGVRPARVTQVVLGCRHGPASHPQRRRYAARHRGAGWWWPPMARTRWSSRLPASPRRPVTTTRWRWSRMSGPISAARGIAFERFSASGPLALLPLYDGAIRWSGHSQPKGTGDAGVRRGGILP